MERTLKRTGLRNEALAKGATSPALVRRRDEAHLEPRLVHDLAAKVRRAARRSEGWQCGVRALAVPLCRVTLPRESSERACERRRTFDVDPLVGQGNEIAALGVEGHVDVPQEHRHGLARRLYDSTVVDRAGQGALASFDVARQREPEGEIACACGWRLSAAFGEDRGRTHFTVYLPSSSI
jgi:hypothetical protein